MFLLSHVNPSPIVSHAMPKLLAAFSSPTFQLPDLTNWMTQTVQPRATARIAVPKAAVDLPFPSPVFTMTTDGAFTVALGGDSDGTSWGSMAAMLRSGTTARTASPTGLTRTLAR